MPLDEGTPQKIFLEASLASAVANRANVPWIVVTIHKPPYCSDNGTPGGFAALLEDTLIKYDVDLMISGHQHCYERIHPVLQGEVTVYPTKSSKLPKDNVDIYYSQSKGPVYVVQGNTGAMQGETWVQPQPAWSAIRFANGFVPRNVSDVVASTEGGSNGNVGGAVLPTDYIDTFGYGVITAYNATHMYYRARADSNSTDIGNDEFWIVKRI
jgi:Calcineurin-like phosphoesterase